MGNQTDLARPATRMAQEAAASAGDVAQSRLTQVFKFLKSENVSNFGKIFENFAPQIP
jgi:hypothetical protein